MTTRVQEARTATPNNPPANGSLLDGQLYVEMATPTRLWVGVPTSIDPTGRKTIVDQTTLGNALNKTGDTATGLINFSAGINVTNAPANVPLAPQDTNTLQAASTSFVLNQGAAGTQLPVMDGATAVVGTSTRWAHADHVHPSDFATQFPGSNALVYIGDTPPTAVDRLLWWSSSDGCLYVRYNDGNSTAWVPATPSTIGQYLPLSGGTINPGPLTINANAAAPTPLGILQVVGANGGNAAVVADAFGGVPSYSGRVAGGTNAARTAVVQGTVLSSLNGFGWSGSAYSYAATIQVSAAENFTGSANGALLNFQVAPPGGTTPISVAIMRTDTGVQIRGTQTNDNAAAGYVGEVITSASPGNSIATGTWTSTSQISLTPGDWDLSGVISFAPSSATVTNAFAGFGTINNAGPNPPIGNSYIASIYNTAGMSGPALVPPVTRFSFNATTIVYLLGYVTYTPGTCTTTAYIYARRAR